MNFKDENFWRHHVKQQSQTQNVHLLETNKIKIHWSSNLLSVKKKCQKQNLWIVILKWNDLYVVQTTETWPQIFFFFYIAGFQHLSKRYRRPTTSLTKSFVLGSSSRVFLSSSLHARHCLCSKSFIPGCGLTVCLAEVEVNLIVGDIWLSGMKVDDHQTKKNMTLQSLSHHHFFFLSLIPPHDITNSISHNISHLMISTL